MKNLKTLPRGVPTGKAALVALALTALAPVAIRYAKPVGQAIARGFGSLAKKTRRQAEAPHQPERTERIDV
jgi:hypothetical protein